VISRRYLAIQRVLGVLVGFTSIIALPPLGLALALGEATAAAFALSFMISASAGLLMWLPARRVVYDMRLRDGFLIVSGVWVVASLVAALPFMLAPPHLSFTRAMFEAVSGLTTTGATLIVGLDALPKSVLLYRQLLQFVGGMGIVVLAVAILPMLRVGGMQLFRAESTAKDSKLTPRIAETAKVLWLIYLGLTVLCAIAYWLAGMNLFDAICHSLSTVSTAGFSTYDASIGHWDSPLIESIAIAFMLAGGINFGLHFLAWRRASMAPYQADAELRAFLLIVLGATGLVAAVLMFGESHEGLGPAVRHAAFQVVSAITTTGFGTQTFADWHGIAPLIIVMLSFIGASSGSTSGGMKVARIVMVINQGLREVRQLVHPKAQYLIKIGDRRVSESVVLSVGGFCTLYVIVYVFVAMAFAAVGMDYVSAFGATAATLNNLGPGLGSVASNFAEANTASIWIGSFAMVLGRLEVFTVLVLLTPAFWKE
jgi:trk system potassium uptake protein